MATVKGNAVHMNSNRGNSTLKRHALGASNRDFKVITTLNVAFTRRTKTLGYRPGNPRSSCSLENVRERCSVSVFIISPFCFASRPFLHPFTGRQDDSHFLTHSLTISFFFSSVTDKYLELKNALTNWCPPQFLLTFKYSSTPSLTRSLTHSSTHQPSHLLTRSFTHSSHLRGCLPFQIDGSRLIDDLLREIFVLRTIFISSFNYLRQVEHILATFCFRGGLVSVLR